MTKKRIATLIEQAVNQPAPPEEDSAIATTRNTQLAELKLTSQGLFDESKALWKEFIAFDREHQLTERVGAQVWRLTKAVGKPALVLSMKGIQAAIITVANPEKRAAISDRFRRSQPAQVAEASLEPVEEQG